MRTPTRRNRNIGTAKQGYSQNNKLVIADHNSKFVPFTENLSNYTKIKHTINDQEFIFVVEDCSQNSFHACSVSDIIHILKHIPDEDLIEFKYIIFRQAKKKERILSPVWGRLSYYYEFEKKSAPAIILEASNLNQKLKWSRKLKPDDQKEFERLKADGHIFEGDKRFYTADFDLEKVRNTQLYRTLLHEIGHYVHYLEFVERPSYENEPYEKWEKRFDLYFKLNSDEKEKYAHRYADEMYYKLKEKGIIPFNKIED